MFRRGAFLGFPRQSENEFLGHGSGPNRSKDRFRRSFICHYVPKSTQRISRHYLPLLTPEGQDVVIEANTGGGACGKPWEDGAYWEGGTH